MQTINFTLLGPATGIYSKTFNQQFLHVQDQYKIQRKVPHVGSYI